MSTLPTLDRVATGAAGAPGATATLTFEQRRKSRQRLRLDDGREAALLLPRGTVLKGGDRLAGGEHHLVVEVRAAPETLSAVRVTDPLALARAAYHLGNRHVPLQITPAGLRYEHDHVLDEMVRSIGLEVQVVTEPFHPEGGAYGAAGHHDHHGHGHGQEEG